MYNDEILQITTRWYIKPIKYSTLPCHCCSLFQVFSKWHLNDCKSNYNELILILQLILI